MMKRLSVLILSLSLLLAITGCETSSPKSMSKEEVLQRLSQALKEQEGYQLTYQQKMISKNEDKAKASTPTTSKRKLQLHYQDEDHLRLQIEESIQSPPLNQKTKFRLAYTILGEQIYENQKQRTKQGLKEYINSNFVQNDPLILYKHALFQQMPNYLKQATMKTTDQGYQFVFQNHASKTIKELLQLKEPQTIGDQLTITVNLSHETFLPTTIKSTSTYHTIEPVQKRTITRTDQWSFKPTSEPVKKP